MKYNPRFLLMAVSFVMFTGIGGTAFSDEAAPFFRNWFGKEKAPLPPVSNKRYLEECGSCHFAYQPGLLPAASWAKLISGLDEHFGENAELPKEEREEIGSYLMNNAADRAASGISAKFMRSLRERQVPLRISEIPYFVKEHDELPRRMVQDNPEVKSFARCDACHTDAAEGIFDEHAVRIPGFGRWEDD